MSFYADQSRAACETGIGFYSALQIISRDIGLKSELHDPAADSIYIDRTLGRVHSDQLPTLAELDIRRRLFDQAEQAFSKEPSIDGVIQGLREIKLGKRGGGRGSYFPSKKNAMSGLPAVAIPVESRVESMYALEMERSHLVQAFRSQAIELDLPGSTSPVYPDFLYVDTGGRLHVREVKANKEFLSQEFRERIEIITGILHKEGISYAVVDLNDMPSGMQSENLFWLHKQYGRIPHPDEVEEFLAIDLERSTYAEVQKLCRSKGLPAEIVPYLLMTDVLKTNWKRRIDNLAEVWK